MVDATKDDEQTNGSDFDANSKILIFDSVAMKEFLLSNSWKVMMRALLVWTTFLSSSLCNLYYFVVWKLCGCGFYSEEASCSEMRDDERYP